MASRACLTEKRVTWIDLVGWKSEATSDVFLQIYFCDLLCILSEVSCASSNLRRKWGGLALCGVCRRVLLKRSLVRHRSAILCDVGLVRLGFWRITLRFKYALRWVSI